MTRYTTSMLWVHAPQEFVPYQTGAEVEKHGALGYYKEPRYTVALCHDDHFGDGHSDMGRGQSYRREGLTLEQARAHARKILKDYKGFPVSVHLHARILFV